MGFSPFIGQVKCFAFNFPPRGWAQCNGQLLAIAQNQALFAILGTTYGGNGTTTFALPDLRGRTPIGVGQGSGLTNRIQGVPLGEENHTLTAGEIPAHTHGVSAAAREGDATSPSGNYPAKAGAGEARYGTTGGGTMALNAVALTGGSQAHTNTMPSLSLNYCIALVGIFPSRP